MYGPVPTSFSFGLNAVPVSLGMIQRSLPSASIAVNVADGRFVLNSTVVASTARTLSTIPARVAAFGDLVLPGRVPWNRCQENTTSSAASGRLIGGCHLAFGRSFIV